MKHRLISLLFVATLVIAVNCTTRGVGPVSVGYAKIGDAKAKIIARPNVNAFTLEEKEISAKVTSKRILVAFELENYADVLTGVIETEGIGKLDDLTKIAASRAVASSDKAEGIFITKMEKTTSGFWPFYEKQVVTVYGKPIRIESKGPLSKEAFDRRYVDWLKRLDAKAELNGKISSRIIKLDTTKAAPLPEPEEEPKGKKGKKGKKKKK